MKIVKLTKEKDTTLVRQLYESAFPPEEKKPFSLILKKSDAGSMEILSIEGDDGSFLGLAIFILYKELALLDYFAISPERRGGGVGTRALALLRTRYTGRHFLLEIEDTDEQDAPNLAERIRRKAFYTRNGLSAMPYRIILFGVRMQVLTDGAFIPFEEYHAIFPAVFSQRIASNIVLYEDKKEPQAQKGVN